MACPDRGPDAAGSPDGFAADRARAETAVSADTGARERAMAWLRDFDDQEAKDALALLAAGVGVPPDAKKSLVAHSAEIAEMRARAEYVLGLEKVPGNSHGGSQLARDVVALTKEVERLAGVGEARPATRQLEVACRELDAFFDGSPGKWTLDGKRVSEEVAAALLSMHDYLNDLAGEARPAEPAQTCNHDAPSATCPVCSVVRRTAPDEQFELPPETDSVGAPAEEQPDAQDEFTYAMDYLAHHPSPVDRDQAIKDARAAYRRLREQLDATQRKFEHRERQFHRLLEMSGDAARMNAVTEQLDAATDALQRIFDQTECSIGLKVVSKHGKFCAYHTASEALLAVRAALAAVGAQETDSNA